MPSARLLLQQRRLLLASRTAASHQARRAFSSSFEPNPVLPIHFEIPMVCSEGRAAPASNADGSGEQGCLQKWHVEVGDPVEAGTPLFDVLEKQGALSRIHAEQEGWLAQQLVEAGSSAPAGFPVGLLVEDEDDIAAFEGYSAPELEDWQAAPACRKRGGLRFDFTSVLVVDEEGAEENLREIEKLQVEGETRGLKMSKRAAELLRDTKGAAYWG